jgi:hypothetical protein
MIILHHNVSVKYPMKTNRPGLSRIIRVSGFYSFEFIQDYLEINSGKGGIVPIWLVRASTLDSSQLVMSLTQDNLFGFHCCQFAVVQS